MSERKEFANRRREARQAPPAEVKTRSRKRRKGRKPWVLMERLKPDAEVSSFWRRIFGGKSRIVDRYATEKAAQQALEATLRKGGLPVAECDFWIEGR